MAAGECEMLVALLAPQPTGDKFMKGRYTIAASIAVAAALVVPAHAGILRDVLSSVGLSKSEAPKDANGTPSYPRQGFACCDLHYNKDWINDYNYSELPMIPAGTPVEVVRYGRHMAEIKVDGKPMRLGQDYGREQETLDQYVKKFIVSEDPRPRIASYPQAVQEAIRQGKVMIGMTREQCIVAVGYPAVNENVTLDAPAWRVWRSSGGEYRLYFGPDGHLSSVSGDGDIESQVVYHPGH
jgi:hypothetical protein